MAIEVPELYGLIAAVVGASFVIHSMFMAVSVGKARRKYKITYPDMYASKENCKNAEHIRAFNCVQRAHQNSLENQPGFLAMLLCAGLKHPVTAAALGSVYLLGRVVYFVGYSAGDPKYRMPGGLISALATMGLLGICISFGVSTAQHW